MNTTKTEHRHEGRALVAAAVVVALLCGSLALSGAGPVDLLSEAAGIKDADTKGVNGVLKVAKAIKTPALVSAAALVPLILIAGGAMLMIGNRMGVKLLASAAGGMMILAAVGGFAA